MTFMYLRANGFPILWRQLSASRLSFQQTPQSVGLLNSAVTLIIATRHSSTSVNMYAYFVTVVASLGAVMLPQVSARPGASNSHGKAIYLTSNDQANTVIAVKLTTDGLLAGGTSTTTGGAGSNSVDGMDLPASPDALVSQSAVTVAGNVSLTGNVSLPLVVYN